MVDSCEVAVVGGGVLGLSVALHLLRNGASDVRVLDRDGVFQGTSGAGGGFLGPWTAISPLHGAESKSLPIERYGMAFYAGLHDQGYDVDYRRNGILWVAASRPAWEQVQSMAWSAADPQSAAVDPAQIERLTGGTITGPGVCGGQYLPSGAQVDTAKVGVALADMIIRMGGVIQTHRPVTGVRRSGDRITGVETAHGPLACGSVVVAAGAWTNQLLAPLDVRLPSVPQVTSRIITEPLGIPDDLPVVMLQGIMPDEPGGGTALWVRAHRRGLLWGGMYATHPRNIFVGAPVPDRFDELPMDGVLENQRVAAAATFMPSLSLPASIRVKHGVPCYTPDNMALMGAVPGFPGLYVLTGDNEVGVTHGPGYGKALADLVTVGSSDLVNLDDWRLDRFGDRYRDENEAFQAVALAIEEERL